MSVGMNDSQWWSRACTVGDTTYVVDVSVATLMAALDEAEPHATAMGRWTAEHLPRGYRVSVRREEAIKAGWAHRVRHRAEAEQLVDRLTGALRQGWDPYSGAAPPQVVA